MMQQHSKFMYKRYPMSSWLAAWRNNEFKMGLHMEGQEQKEEADLAHRVGFEEWTGLRKVRDVITEIGHFFERLENQKLLVDLHNCEVVFNEAMAPASHGNKSYTIISFRGGPEQQVVARVWINGHTTAPNTKTYSHALRVTLGLKSDLLKAYVDREFEIFANSLEEFLVRLIKAEQGVAPEVVTIGDVAESQQRDREARELAQRQLAAEVHPKTTSIIEPGQIFSMGWFYDNNEHRYVLKANVQINLRELSDELRRGYPPGVTMGQHQKHLHKVLLERKLATEDYILEFCAPKGDTSDMEDGSDLEEFLSARRP